MLRSFLSALIVGSFLWSGVATAGLIGGSAVSAAYSAKQIKITSPTAPSGIYWLDVDGAGGLNPFTTYADMTTGGGGWTMVHDRTNVYPDMDSFWQSVLSSYGPMQLRISTQTGLDTAFNFSPSLVNTPFSFIANPNTWTYFSGNPGLVNNPFQLPYITLSQVMADANLKANYTIYVKELTTPAYVAPITPVPEPETYALLLAGLGLMGFIARRRNGQGGLMFV